MSGVQYLGVGIKKEISYENNYSKIEPYLVEPFDETQNKEISVILTENFVFLGKILTQSYDYGFEDEEFDLNDLENMKLDIRKKLLKTFDIDIMPKLIVFTKFY